MTEIITDIPAQLNPATQTNASLCDRLGDFNGIAATADNLVGRLHVMAPLTPSPKSLRFTPRSARPQVPRLRLVRETDRRSKMLPRTRHT